MIEACGGGGGGGGDAGGGTDADRDLAARAGCGSTGAVNAVGCRAGVLLDLLELDGVMFAGKGR